MFLFCKLKHKIFVKQEYLIHTSHFSNNRFQLTKQNKFHPDQIVALPLVQSSNPSPVNPGLQTQSLTPFLTLHSAY